MRLYRSLMSRFVSPFVILALALVFECSGYGQTDAQNTLSPRNMFGTNFSISVPEVESGQYMAVFGFIETEFTAPGQRVFDIKTGDTIIASNVDIFAAAGGAGKPYFLRIPVQHRADVEGGPISFTFTARKGMATLNSFELRNASGATVFHFNAEDMAITDGDSFTAPHVSGPVLWTNAALSLDVRLDDLISRMSLGEKVAELRNNEAPIWRLGVPAYDFWSECLHGVARAGVATVFPQVIGMAATWDVPMIHQVADTISTEARAKHNLYALTHDGNSVRYLGLTFWTPNINIFRDPRWGRGQETYGEDPFLTGQMAVAFIRGLQGDDPKYIKALACAKHFAVHSGPESERHQFNAEPPERDLFEIYLPQFEAAVRQGHVGAVMAAYNDLNGEPCCSNPALLTELLRHRWGFDGHVVSDCDAINDIFEGHAVVANSTQAAARALKAGLDLCCGTNYNDLVAAVRLGLVNEQQIDTAVRHVFTARFRLGLFDPPDMVPYSKIPITENDSPEHERLALRTAEESMVLLKNDGVLPLQRDKIKRLAVVGENAVSIPVLLGNYNGSPSKPVTILEGIKAIAGEGMDVVFAPGCPLALPTGQTENSDVADFSNALAVARTADAIVYVGGISPYLEGEFMEDNFDGFYWGDRTRIELPALQTELLKALHAIGKPVVFVNCSGSAVAMPWEIENIPAIVQAWYPGEQGGRAVAEVLFGDLNPAGRLPITFYSSTEDLPSFDNYSMANRTYRFFKGTPQFAFGHGLSYTHFDYSKPTLASAQVPANGTLKLSFDVSNSGPRDGDEVAQVYVRRTDSNDFRAKEALCGFTRVHIARNQSANVSLEIPLERFRCWDTTAKKYVVEPGAYELMVGAASDDIRARLPVKVVAAD
jgi:beta-glucosidase